VNILDEANKIINERSEEKERQYGDMFECMETMRNIFNAQTKLDLTTEHMYIAMVAMKLARQSYAHKEDNLLDSVAYLGSLNDYIENKKTLKK